MVLAAGEQADLKNAPGHISVCLRAAVDTVCPAYYLLWRVACWPRRRCRPWGRSTSVVVALAKPSAAARGKIHKQSSQNRGRNGLVTQTLIFLPSRPLFLQALRYPNSIDLALTLHVFTSFTRAFPSQREGGDEKAAWRGKRSAFSFKLVPFSCSISFYTTTVPLKLYFQSSCIHLTFFCVSMSMHVGYAREERERRSGRAERTIIPGPQCRTYRHAAPPAVTNGRPLGRQQTRRTDLICEAEERRKGRRSRWEEGDGKLRPLISRLVPPL